MAACRGSALWFHKNRENNKTNTQTAQLSLYGRFGDFQMCVKHFPHTFIECFFPTTLTTLFFNMWFHVSEQTKISNVVSLMCV